MPKRVSAVRTLSGTGEPPAPLQRKFRESNVWRIGLGRRVRSLDEPLEEELKGRPS